MMCVVHTVRGEWAEAEAAVEQSIALAGRHAWALATLAIVYGRTGRRPEANAIIPELEASTAMGAVPAARHGDRLHAPG
jgi:Flp pilus assembly protein TadD